MKSYSGIQKVTIDGVDQHISSFVIKDVNGNTAPSWNLNLYVKQGVEHTIIITDADGVEHIVS